MKDEKGGRCTTLREIIRVRGYMKNLKMLLGAHTIEHETVGSGYSRTADMLLEWWMVVGCTERCEKQVTAPHITGSEAALVENTALNPDNLFSLRCTNLICAEVH